ncbi:MAG: hypothetical protein ACKVPY_03730 [Paracoccaceae bacterium]
MRPGFALPLFMGLAACGAMSVERAEESCVAEAKAARGPTGTVAVGATSDGPRAEADVTISSDWVFGRDPEEVYASCVMRRSGKAPVTMLVDRPEWRR